MKQPPLATRTADERQMIASAATWVVKVGSRVLTDEAGRLDQLRIHSLADQISSLVDTGKQVVLISSGAVAAGIGKLGLSERPQSVSELQAVAAIGQTQLIQTYEQYFSHRKRHAAQVLLVADDLQDRQRYLNVRNTLLALLELDVVPIINENDSVAVEELQATFGDNDRLAAMVASLFERPLLVILSDVDGVFDRHPKESDATIVRTISDVDERILSMAAASDSKLSKGGMSSKLQAARFAMRSGSPVLIGPGRNTNVLQEIAEGIEIGTLFLSNERSLSSKKKWLGFSASTSGQLTLDDGACHAIIRDGSSLLAIGITALDGVFEKGDLLSLCNDSGQEIGRGLTNYGSAELKQIIGKRSTQIEPILGHCPYEEVIHRNNLLANT